MIFTLLKRRKKGSVMMRAAIGGLLVTVTALYALVVFYDISVGRLTGYLVGTVAVLLGIMLAAMIVVLGWKALSYLLRRLFGLFVDNGDGSTRD